MESFYRWNPDSMTRVFALPAQVVDKHIRLAGSAQRLERQGHFHQAAGAG